MRCVPLSCRGQEPPRPVLDIPAVAHHTSSPERQLSEYTRTVEGWTPWTGMQKLTFQEAMTSIIINIPTWRVSSQHRLPPFWSIWDIWDLSCWKIKKIIRNCCNTFDHNFKNIPLYYEKGIIGMVLVCIIRRCPYFKKCQKWRLTLFAIKFFTSFIKSRFFKHCEKYIMKLDVRKWLCLKIFAFKSEKGGIYHV